MRHWLLTVLLGKHYELIKCFKFYPTSYYPYGLEVALRIGSKMIKTYRAGTLPQGQSPSLTYAGLQIQSPEQQNTSVLIKRRERSGGHQDYSNLPATGHTETRAE